MRFAVSQRLSALVLALALARPAAARESFELTRAGVGDWTPRELVRKHGPPSFTCVVDGTERCGLGMEMGDLDFRYEHVPLRWGTDLTATVDIVFGGEGCELRQWSVGFIYEKNAERLDRAALQRSFGQPSRIVHPLIVPDIMDGEALPCDAGKGPLELDVYDALGLYAQIVETTGELVELTSLSPSEPAYPPCTQEQFARAAAGHE